MKKKVTITDYKTKRINNLTGGMIVDYTTPDYHNEEGILTNSFVSYNGVYIGDYASGWWYVKNNMVVNHKFPNGVAIVLKEPVRYYKYLDEYKNTGKIRDEYVRGYYGYSHRGGQIFSLGDRLFDELYIPKKEDYTQEEWDKFIDDREIAIKREIDEYGMTEEEVNKMPIADVILFKKRGAKIIKIWEEAEQAAINMAKYLA